MTSFQFITVSERALQCTLIIVNCHSFATVLQHKDLGYVCFIQVQIGTGHYKLRGGGGGGCYKTGAGDLDDQ